MAARFELSESLIENARPNFWVVPVILMAQKSDVSVLAKFRDFTELVATVSEESGANLIADVLPAAAGGVDFGGSDVESLQVGGGGFFTKDSGENGGFIGPATGEIQEIKVIFFCDERGKVVTQGFFQLGEVGGGVFVKKVGIF